jgi:hypothetical protein
VTPCILREAYGRFGKTYRLYPRGRRISWPSAPARCKQQAKNSVSLWLLAWLNLPFWRWKQYVLPKRRCTSNELYGVTSKKILYSHRCEYLSSGAVNCEILPKHLRAHFRDVSNSGTRHKGTRNCP